jgi:hypothetical protein
MIPVTKFYEPSNRIHTGMKARAARVAVVSLPLWEANLVPRAPPHIIPDELPSVVWMNI